MSEKPKPKQELSQLGSTVGKNLVHWPEQMAMALYDFKATKKASSWVTYEVALRTFFQFIGMVGVRSPADVTRTHLTSYIDWLKQEGKADRTIVNYCAACSSFFDFLCRPVDTKGTAIILSNPWKSMKGALPTINAYEKATDLRELNPEEYQKLIATCDLTTVMGKRDYAIMTTTLWTTRRRQEIARLRWKDFGQDGDIRYITFLQKGGSKIRIDLTAQVWEAIQGYWEMAGRRMKPESPAWIATVDSAKYLNMARNIPMKKGEQPLAPSALDDMIKSRGRQAGLDSSVVSVHMHGLRHLGARMLRAMGIDLKEIKERLGHASIKTTDIYLGSMDRVGSEGLEAFAKAVMGA